MKNVHCVVCVAGKINAPLNRRPPNTNIVLHRKQTAEYDIYILGERIKNGTPNQCVYLIRKFVKKLTRYVGLLMCTIIVALVKYN